MSKQFWSYLVAQGLIESPEDFIKYVPDHSCVFGDDNVKYLKKRFEVMKNIRYVWFYSIHREYLKKERLVPFNC
ncbi:MAG: L-2-hydroxyglutarate oxidase LhgO [Psychroserpens sp.]|jgi:malate dehydrogenase (quinone)